MAHSNSSPAESLSCGIAMPGTMPNRTPCVILGICGTNSGRMRPPSTISVGLNMLVRLTSPVTRWVVIDSTVSRATGDPAFSALATVAKADQFRHCELPVRCESRGESRKVDEGFEAAAAAAAAERPVVGDPHMPEFGSRAAPAPHQPSIQDGRAAAADAKLEIDDEVAVRTGMGVDLAEGRGVGVVLDEQRRLDLGGCELQKLDVLPSKHGEMNHKPVGTDEAGHCQSERPDLAAIFGPPLERRMNLGDAVDRILRPGRLAYDNSRFGDIAGEIEEREPHDTDVDLRPEEVGAAWIEPDVDSGPAKLTTAFGLRLGHLDDEFAPQEIGRPRWRWSTVSAKAGGNVRADDVLQCATG